MENIERIVEDLCFVTYVHCEGSFVGITVVLGRHNARARTEATKAKAKTEIEGDMSETPK